MHNTSGYRKIRPSHTHTAADMIMHTTTTYTHHNDMIYQSADKTMPIKSDHIEY